MSKLEDGSPSCWICLCDEPDDTGVLPVRDCSCRGDTGAGYAHLSCLVQYAQMKTMETLKNPSKHKHHLLDAWKKCPICEQSYQHQLALDLANYLVLFVETISSKHNNPIDYVLMVAALRTKVDAIHNNNETREKHDLRLEGITTANRILSSLKHMKTTLMLDSKFEIDSGAMVNFQLATFYMLEGDDTSSSREKALYHFQMSHDLYMTNGNSAAAEGIQSTIHLMKNGRMGNACRRDQLETTRQYFNDQVRKFGMDSRCAIKSGLTLARALFMNHRFIESERILTKYVPISRRVHGEEHAQTKEIDEVLDKFTARFVLLENGEEFKALRYEDEGEKCVVLGPMKKSHYYEGHNEGTEYTVDSNSLLICRPGAPIIVQGLKQSTHLNGKLADVRSYDKDKDRYTIYFEDKSLKPVAVKKENVRIVFDLPDVE